MKLAVAAVLSAAFLSSAAFAQVPDGPPPPDAGMHRGGPRMDHGFDHGMGRVPAPVTNAPFSAKFAVESQHNAPGPDGVVSRFTTTDSIYRDSLGRTREDITLPAPQPHPVKSVDGANAATPAAPATPRTMTVIYDPVANTVTRLMPERKVAVVETVPPAFFKHALDHQAKELAGETRPHDDATVTALGSKTFAGVSATGRRTTHTMHAPPDTATAAAATSATGSATTMTREEWFSPDLKLEVSSTETSPRGSHTNTLTSLTKAEPDAALFKVPEGYTVRNGPPHSGPGGFHHGPRPDGTPDAPPPPAM